MRTEHHDPNFNFESLSLNQTYQMHYFFERCLALIEYVLGAASPAALMNIYLKPSLLRQFRKQTEHLEILAIKNGKN